MTEENITLNEIIINIVRDNKCIYDKTDSQYKNHSKKKDVWKLISFQLKDVYNVDMSAEDVEKRWSTLRDMFSREERKKKLAPSGSGRSESKEWHLYQSLLFLSSHIAHRKTKESFIQKPTKISSSQTVSLQQTSSQLLENNNFSYNIITPFIPANAEGEASQEVESLSLIDTYSESETIDSDAQSVINSEYSHSSSNSFPVTPTFSKTVTNPIQKKNVPPLDNFVKRRKIKSAQLDEQLIEAGTAISGAMNTMSTLISNTANKEKDGCMLVIEESLKHVPNKSRTQCIIEVLQVVQKYEVRD